MVCPKFHTRTILNEMIFGTGKILQVKKFFSLYLQQTKWSIKNKFHYCFPQLLVKLSYVYVLFG